MNQRKHKISASSETYWVADLLHSASIHLLRTVRARDQSTGIGPAQLSALSVLVFAGPRSLKELAHAEQVRPPTMSRIVTGLVRAGLVRRKATDDKRRLRLEATAKGTRILQEGRRRRVELLAQSLQSLPPSQLQAATSLAQLMQKLIAKLQSSERA
jgi:DNA-binding MarR family transcriptional regulator